MFLVLFILSGILYLNIYLEENYEEDAFTLPDSIKTVFIGDSHALTAFNTEFIPKSFNASKNSEGYFATYYKLGAILNANPKIENVVLTYSYHNISITQNANVLYGDVYYYLYDEKGRYIIQSSGKGELIEFRYGSSESYLKSLISNLSHFSISTFLWVKYEIGLPVGANKYINFAISRFGNDPKLNLHPIFQETYKSTKSNLDTNLIINSIERDFYYRNEVNSSDIMIESLFRMAELCNIRRVNLVLINTPLHPLYKSKIPGYYFQLHNSIIDSLKNKYDNIQYYNFTTVNYPDSLFGDGDHLNYYGMKIFSKETKDLFNQ